MATQWLGSKCSTATIALAIAAALSASTAISLYFWRRKCRGLESKIRELQKSLKSSSEKCGAERQGRIRAQQISVISSKLVRQSYAAALKTGHASGVQSEGNGESGLQITPQNQLVVMHNSLKEMETQLVEAMRKALAYPKSDNLELSSYPMAPIGVIQSCFSTRNGTPRQPLLVPLARACLVFDPTRVPPASLEGLGEYSHCWIIYVFHLNTDLEKLWKEPSKSKFKAKVRVPRLKGGRMGVFATRSPHRPCPIGLTVAKVEAVEENMVLLSGVDLVDGTPVVDVKPYLPYCDAIKGATVPKWVMEDNLLEVASVSFSEGFPSILADCWVRMGKKSLYASPEEFQSLIKQVLSWDIRSPSQRNRPYDSHVEIRNGKASVSDSDSHRDEEASTPTSDQASLSFGGIIYHLNLEGLDVSYRINCDGDVIVEKVTISPDIPNSHRSRCNSSSWIDKSR